MRLQARFWRSATPALLPVATAGLAIGICIADILTPPDTPVAVLYVVVVLMATRFCRPPGIVLVAAGCIGLTVLGYFLSAENAIDTAIGIAAIGAATFLALQSQSAEAALREQASLLDLTHDSIVARRFDDDVITYWSRGAEELFGWQRAEAVGRVGSELRKTAVPLPLDQIKAELLRVGRWEGELVNNKRDGTLVLVTSRWSLDRDRHGRPTTIIVTSNDITERKHAEQALRESEEQWREIFEHNPVMYFMVDATGTVLSVNGFGAAQLGYTAAELVGQSVLNVFFDEERDLVKDQLATCVEELGRPHSWEIRKIRKDGTVLWVRENAKAVQRSANDAIVLIACEDITARRRGEQRVAAAYAVTRILAEADSLAAAAPHILLAIGENLEWDWGALWSIHREGTPLRCDCLWHAPDMATAEFDTVCRERIFAVGEGRLGQVWRSAEPIWMVDATTEPEFLRASAASRAGLHGGVIFPILLDTEALGVVELFSRAARERDEEQLATLSAIGSQIGQFIKRRAAEAGLRASEVRWRAIFEAAAVGITTLDFEQGVRGRRYVTANEAFQRMTGYTEDELRNLTPQDISHEDDRAVTQELRDKAIAGLRSYRIEKRYRRKNGDFVWADVNTFFIPATDSTSAFLGVVAVDITDRKRAEAALRASEERWRTVFETTAVGITTLDEHGKYMTANASFQRMTGYTEDELRNLTPSDFTHEADRAAARKLREDTVASGQQSSFRIEKRYRRKHGKIVWADVNTFFVPPTESTPAFFAAIIVDITDRKRTEAELRASEERWRTVFETAAVGIATLDLDLRYVTANAAYQRMTGYVENELRYLTAHDITHEDDRATTRKVIDDVAASPQNRRRIEKRYRRKDGEIVWADVNNFLVPATDSTPAFLGAMIVDITDRKRAEAALRASEQRWRAMFENTAVGIATVDFQREKYVTANESFQRLTGYNEDELRNLNPLDITHEDGWAATQMLRDVADAGPQRTHRIEKRYRRKDGEIVWADVNEVFVPATESTPAFLGVMVVDITYRKRAEEALQQAQADLARLNRVMTLGEMTASIAHEVNQPITAVVANANAGLRWLGAQQPDLDEVRQALGRIVRDGTRAGEVIGRIREHVKKSPPHRDVLDINEVICEVVALTQTETQRNAVRLQSRLADDLPLVSADRVQLQQVMINLIINAIEAMAGAGDGPRELTIVSGIDDANDVVVEVQDTGPGLDPEKLDRLFQSFYTTKLDGIGMGLAISRSIAEAHGGRLSAAPNKPRGAVFRLTLPVEATLSGNPERSRP